MPSLADFERDYWAPDREEVLAQMRAEQAPAAAPPQEAIYGGAGYYDPGRGEFDPGWGIEMGGGGYQDIYTGGSPAFNEQVPSAPAAGGELANFEANYWAPDREQVLSQMRQQAAPPRWSTPGMPAGGGYGGGGGQFDETALSQAWLSSGGRTPQDLANFFANNPQLTGGAKLVGSKKDKIQLPNGRVVDAVLASGEGGRGAQWLVEGPGGGGGGGAVGGGGGASYGRAPNPTPFNYETFKRPGEFQGPGRFQYEAFQAPDALTLQNDPGYQARLALGTDAIEKSAAARGTLLTGGTMKDLNQFAQDYGSNEFQNVYNRAFQTHGQNYNQAAADWATNYQNQLGEYQTNYQNALNAYRTNFETQFKPWEANYQQAYNSWMGNYNAAQSEFQNSLASQNQRYNQLMGGAQLGLQAANQYGGLMQQGASNLGNIYSGFGNQAGENITGAGNATAAGQVGSAGAWGSGLNQVGNAANMAAMYSLYNNGYEQPSNDPYNWSKNMPKVNL